LTLAITVDHFVDELYADGVLLPQLAHYDDWTTVDTVVIPAGTSVIAVKARARDANVSSSLHRVSMSVSK